MRTTISNIIAILDIGGTTATKILIRFKSNYLQGLSAAKKILVIVTLSDAWTEQCCQRRP